MSSRGVPPYFFRKSIKTNRLRSALSQEYKPKGLIPLIQLERTRILSILSFELRSVPAFVWWVCLPLKQHERLAFLLLF